MESIKDGIIKAPVNPEHPLKALLPINEIDSGNSKFPFNPEHPSKAPDPIDVTEEGICNPVKFEQ